MQTVPLPGESTRPERTHIWTLAVRLTLDQALLLEFLRALRRREGIGENHKDQRLTAMLELDMGFIIQRISWKSVVK